MTVTDQLNKVIDKTGRLIELCEALKQENYLLKQENASLNQAVDSRNILKTELEEQLRVLTLARSLEGIPSADLGLDEKTLDIKQKITEFVREIDKCIVLLKK
jgi:hypothetical protein